MNPNQVLMLIENDETQTIELKESLSVGCKHEGTRSLVAFANRDGGRVIFGVDTKRALKGVQLGQRTREDLANFVTSHTYPALPVHIECVPVAGLDIVIAETTADRPPVVGAYLYSADELQSNKPIEAKTLSTFRRVGRTNQRSDLMWLRPSLPTDPKVRISISRVIMSDPESFPENLVGQVWVEPGSATAHHIRVFTEPMVYETDWVVHDLPIPVSLPAQPGVQANLPRDFVEQWQSRNDVRLTSVAGAPRSPFWVVAEYRDDLGLIWEAKRHMTVLDTSEGYQLGVSEFSRGIRVFPPPRQQS